MNLYTYLEEVIDKITPDGRTILIYHGLGGGVDEQKVNYFESKGFKVIMKKHDYRKEFGTLENPSDKGLQFMRRQEKIAKGADIIIGSSFGGYVAYLLGCQLHKDLILINPALNRSVTKTAIQEFDYPHNEHMAKSIEYFHGSEDIVVTAKTSMDVLRKPSKYKEVLMQGMGHNTPFKKFKEICEQSEILNVKN